MIKVHKKPPSLLYYISAEDGRKLEAIMKHYNIEVSPLCYVETEVLFLEEELNKIEKQWKLARKQERQK